MSFLTSISRGLEYWLANNCIEQKTLECCWELLLKIL